ncbi:MAG: hypothetical protein AAGE94_25010, partial [Acidobacteriota bacterium]
DAFGGVGAMAYHFRELTGIDPLTIDQTALSERGRVELEHPLYRELCGDGERVEAVAFRDARGALWSLPDEDRDITVCLPSSRYAAGRATWLQAGGLRRPVELPPGLCRDVAPCVVDARPIDEGSDAIPIDRVVVRRDEPMPALMLPEGRFLIEAWSMDDRRIGRIERRVGGATSEGPRDRRLR